MNDRSVLRGFTFVELMMTLAIMAVLAVLAVPVAQIAVQREKERDLRFGLIQIREALDAHKRAAEQGRVLVKVDGTGYPESLDDLVVGVVDRRSPSGRKLYFLRRLPRDPLHPDPAAPTSETWGIRSYASSPDAPEQGDDVFDVYSKAEGVGLNGVPYRDW